MYDRHVSEWIRRERPAPADIAFLRKVLEEQKIEVAKWERRERYHREEEELQPRCTIVADLYGYPQGVVWLPRKIGVRTADSLVTQARTPSAPSITLSWQELTGDEHLSWEYARAHNKIAGKCNDVWRLYANAFFANPQNRLMLHYYLGLVANQDDDAFFKGIRPLLTRVLGAEARLSGALSDRLTLGVKGNRELRGHAVDETLAVELMTPWERLNNLFWENEYGLLAGYRKRMVFIRSILENRSDPWFWSDHVRDSAHPDHYTYRGCTAAMQCLFNAECEETMEHWKRIIEFRPDILAGSYPFSPESLAIIGKELSDLPMDCIDPLLTRKEIAQVFLFGQWGHHPNTTSYSDDLMTLVNTAPIGEPNAPTTGH